MMTDSTRATCHQLTSFGQLYAKSPYSHSSDAAIVTDPRSIKTAFFAHSFFDLYHFHEFFGFLVSK
jgi:hypothetical protein